MSVSSSVRKNVREDMLGASKHALGRASKYGLAALQAQPPKPPLWKRKELLPYALSVLMLLITLGVEASMRFQTYMNQQKLINLEAEFSEKLLIKKTEESTVSQGQRLSEKIKDYEQTLLEQKQTLTALQRLVYRQDLISGMLLALQTVTSDEVVLDSMRQKPGQQEQFYLVGWALTNTAAQLFINNLGRNMARWNIQVQDSRVNASTNRFDGKGYKTEVWLRLAEKVEP